MLLDVAHTVLKHAAEHDSFDFSAKAEVDADSRLIATAINTSLVINFPYARKHLA